MSRGLRNLVVKEVKEMLRDPKILIGMVLMPLLIFPAMGFAIRTSQTAVEEAVKESLKSMAVLNLDGGQVAQSLINFLKANPDIKLIEVEAPSVKEALEALKETNITVLLAIPKGFSHNLTNGLRGSLELYVIFKSISIPEAGKASAAGIPITLYESALILHIIQQTFPRRDPRTVLDPIDIANFMIFKDKIVKAPPEALLREVIMSQSIGFPMAIMMVLIAAMHIAATSIAIEKEEKTLETLLTLPVERSSILIGKLAGSAIVAAAGAIATILGVSYYAGSIIITPRPNGIAPAEAPTIDLEALGLTLSPLAYLLLGVTMFITMLSALALAICIAVFSENVRSAETLVSYLIIPIMIPSVFLMLADINILPLAIQIILYAIPYTYPIIATRAAFIGDYFTMLTGIAYISLFTITILYIATKIFTTERVVTARISFKKLKKE